jgi:hypothetical protein
MTPVAKAMSTDRGGCCFNRRYICERVIIYEGGKSLSDSSAARKWAAGHVEECKIHQIETAKIRGDTIGPVRPSKCAPNEEERQMSKSRRDHDFPG